MSSSEEKMNGRKNISTQLRRLAGSESNRRHLRELPQFQVSRDMPEQLAALLRQLDAADEQAAGR